MFYQFDEFRVDAERRRLLRAGQHIPLTPKVFDLLLVLIENQGQILEKDRLMGLLWSDSFVEESNIVQNVAVLRRALGETSKENRFIATVPGQGYRFVPEVRTSSGSFAERRVGSLPAPGAGGALTLVRSGASSRRVGLAVDARAEAAFLDHSDPETAAKLPVDEVPQRIEPPAKRFPISSLAAFVAVLFIGGFLTYLITSYRRPTPPPSIGTPKIAVLPPRPVNENDRDRGTEFAITHSLILKLSEPKSFEVSQLSAVRKYVDFDEEPFKIGNDLGVSFVLASNYQVSQGRIRVTSQLLNISTGNVEQTFSADAVWDKTFGMQDTISNAIGDGVLGRFGRPAGTFVARRGTQSEEAHNLFYESLYLVEKGTRDDSAKAADLLGRAVQLDPAYANAWALRAQAYCQVGHTGGGNPRQIFTVAEPMLEKALGLDNSNATALMVRGTINRDYHWRFDEAYRDLQEAIDLDPGSCQAHRILAGLYYRDGQFQKALEEERKALEINPTSLMDRWFVGFYLLGDGKRDEGVAQLKRIIEIDPSFPLPHDTLWQLYHREGDSANAYAHFLKAKEASGAKPDELAHLTSAYSRSGWPGVLRTALEQARNQDPKGEYSGRKFYIASLAALLNEKDMAFDYLEEALRYRALGISFLKVDPKLNSLRSDSRFKELLVRANLSSSL